MSTDPTGYISIPPDLIRGLSWKVACRCATTANITLSGNQTIDGVATATGNRVLVKNQSTASQNGIWIASSGAWTRAYDMDQDLTTSVPAEEIAGALVWVVSGTANGGTLWYTTNALGGTIGSTAINWSHFTTASLLTVKDEGTTLDTAVTSLDFVGAGGTATNVGHAVTVTIPGGASGAAGGDLSGSYPNPTVAKINGSPLGTLSPATADRLRWDGSAWVNSALFWRNVMTLDPTSGNYLPVTTGSGDAVYTEA